MITKQDLSTNAFYLSMKPEDREDEKLLEKMVNERRYGTLEEINGKIQEITIFIPVQF